MLNVQGVYVKHSLQKKPSESQVHVYENCFLFPHAFCALSALKSFNESTAVPPYYLTDIDGSL